MPDHHLFSDLLPQPAPIRQVITQAGPALLGRPSSTSSKGLMGPTERSNPWTRVGTAFAPSPDAQEAFLRSGLDWAVEKIGLRTDDLAPVPDQYAIRRTDTGKVLGTVGTDYVPLQNREAFTFFQDLAGDGRISFETAGSFDRGSIVWVQARLPDLQIRIGEDVSETMLFISNGHIGNKLLTIAPTTYRIICRNTLRMAEGQNAADRRQQPGLAVGWTVRHTRGMSAALADIREAYARTRRSHAVTVQVFEHLAGKRRTHRLEETFIGRVFPAGPDESGRARAIAQARRERIGAILASPTSQVRGTRETAFSLLQAVIEYIDHDRTTRTHDGQTAEEGRLASATFGSGAELKARAWSTMLELVR